MPLPSDPISQGVGCHGCRVRSTELSRIVSLQFKCGERFPDDDLAGCSMRAGQIVSLQFSRSWVHRMRGRTTWRHRSIASNT